MTFSRWGQRPNEGEPPQSTAEAIIATKQITDFTAVTTAAVGDLLLTQQAADSVTRKLTLTQLDTLLAATTKTLTNKTLTTPTIADLSNMTHTHENAAGGGTLSAAAIAAGTLVVARGGTNSSTALNNSRIMVSSGGAITEAGALTNGQLLIGSTGLAPVAATLTQGANITITNGAGTITIAAAASAESGTWSNVTGSRALSTVYQNTSGTKRRVAVNITGVNTGTAEAYLEVGSANPPTLAISYPRIFSNASTTHRLNLVGEVPNNWYYRVVPGATESINAWFELDE